MFKSPELSRFDCDCSMEVMSWKERVGPERPIGCDECVLVEGYAGATFKRTTRGRICNFCRDFREREFLGKEALIENLSLKANEKIGVTVSGGKDSTYVWLWLCENFGSDRVVAFNHKKVGLVHPFAEKNLESARKELGSKLIQLVDHKFLARFKNNLRALLSQPDAAMVRVALCAGCRFGISGDLFREAAKLGIRRVINGASYLELAPFKRELLRIKGDGNETRGLLRGLEENTFYYLPGNLMTAIRDSEHRHTTHLSEGKGKRFYPNVTYLDFYRYFPNIPKKIEKEIVGKLGWQRPKEDDWHFDCLVAEFKDLFYYGMLGYSEIDYRLCEMIRYNIISRDAALTKLRRSRKQIIANIDPIFNFLRKIGSADLIPQLKRFIDRSKYLRVSNIESLPAFVYQYANP